MAHLKNYKRMLVLALAVVLVVGLAVGLNLTKPYAVYADGTKVEDPYVVKAGEKELFLVEDEETAENVIQAVIKEYSPEGAKINSISVDQKISTDNKSLSRFEDTQTVLTEDEAVERVLEQNDTDNPYFNVVISADMGSVEDIEKQTIYEENDDMYEGETEVKEEGSEGSSIVTNEVTCVNGTVLTSQKVDTTVVNESEDKVIYKGTKERPKDTIRADYSGQIMGNGSGNAVLNFAKQFVGNPYVYGGTSLTNGADCSGFVQSVYKHFGISLPRTVGPQSYCGKGVSYAEAKPGDLIVYSGHIGIYAGGGKVVNAANSRKGIVVASTGTYGKVVTVRRIVE